MKENPPMKKIIALSTALILMPIALITPAEAATKSCALTQAIEEGPYYLANTPTRSDVTDGQAGKAINLSFTVLDSACKPIKNARVDIWYANAQGVYSGVANQGDDLGAGVNSGNFLRGTQYSNVKGVVTFKGIYPGWYPARTIHIHEKIWVGGKQVLTTQTYFTDKQNAAVMATSPYNKRGAQRVSNATDMVLTRGSTNLDAALMKLVGSTASFTIVVNK
jgi:protocatechuate 3,4-dioxygenase beta subunit